MLRQNLILAGLFSLAFAMTLWLFFDRSTLPTVADLDPPGKSLSSVGARTPPMEGGRILDSPRATPEDAGQESPGLPDSETAITSRHGSMIGRVRGPNGQPTGVVGVQVNPGGPETRVVNSDSNGYEVIGIPPGIHRVTIWADGFVASQSEEVVIRANSPTRLDVSLEPGICPEGIVQDAQTSRPIANAEIRLANGLRLASDSMGRFRAAYCVPATALESVSVDHADYDRSEWNQAHWPDPKNMTLALSSGQATLRVRLVGQREAPLPERAKITLEQRPGGDRRIVRRNISIDPRNEVLVRGIQPGQYDVTVEFPGNVYPKRRRTVSLAYSEVALEIPLEGGARVQGQLLSRRGGVQRWRVEFVGSGGEIVGATTSNEKGGFALDGMEAGHYRVRLAQGSRHFNTDPFTCPDHGVVTVQVDCDARRLKR